MPDADLPLLLSTLKEAGRLALSFDRKSMRHWRKPDGSVVTEADRAVDELLKARIAAARPEDGWLSEETPDTSERLGKQRLWIADPIDGTRGFLNDTGPWGIGMAFIENGEPVISAVFRPDDDQMFHARRGGGSFCNGNRLSATRAATLKSTMIIMPRKFRATAESAGATVDSNSDLPLLLRLACVAKGELGGCVSAGHKSDWDIAAGHLLVTEAGGRVTTLCGGEVIYNRAEPWQPGLVASGCSIHSQLLDCVRQA